MQIFHHWYSLLNDCTTVAKDSSVTVVKSARRLSLIINLTFFLKSRGGGVHDLRMDGGLPPGFQKGTLF